MDKYQRKHIAKWEAKKAKAQEKLEEEVKRNSYQRALEHIDKVVREWQPSPNDIFANARSLAENPTYRPILYRFMDEDQAFMFINRHRMMYSRMPRFSMNSLEVASAITEQTSWKRESETLKLASTLSRHQARISAIREELLEKTIRLRAIQNCLRIKEELMMNLWHPRRVAYVLETYGWDVYDNLLGI